MDLKIIDNCIKKEHQDLIVKELLETKNFSWFFCKDITFNNTDQKRPAFSHYFIKDKKVNSAFINLVLPIVSSYTNNKIIQCRSFLQLPLNSNLISADYDTPHIDFNFPHTVYLYYVKDSDGDTLFLKDNKIVKRVTPKKGRLVIFDGSILHTAEQPKKDIRCIINFDLIKSIDTQQVK